MVRVHLGTRPSLRCERCRLTPRWCVCAAHKTVDCGVAVDILMHVREAVKPTSTGHLITRTVPDSRIIPYEEVRTLDRASIGRPGKDLWILHPRGGAVPEDADPSQVQVLLIDGNWKQSVHMLHALEGMGRRVRLPMEGESRFWLRTQHESGHFSTIEALLFLLGALGLREQQAALRLQFELHVYAGLRARGAKELADQFLASSPLPEAMGPFLEGLCARRPLLPPAR